MQTRQDNFALIASDAVDGLADNPLGRISPMTDLLAHGKT